MSCIRQLWALFHVLLMIRLPPVNVSGFWICWQLRMLKWNGLFMQLALPPGEGLPKVEVWWKPLSLRDNEIWTVCWYFSKTYGLETIGLRYFNVFGRKQDPTEPTQR
jgi:hypothetical protein